MKAHRDTCKQFPPWSSSRPIRKNRLLLLPGLFVVALWQSATVWGVELEFGDAPESALAYPSSGVVGSFPTCMNAPPAGWIQHNNFGAQFGPSFDFEPDGNAGLCPLFNPNTYDQDECFQDGDAGLLFPPSFTITGPVGGEVVIPCMGGIGALGSACQAAAWGGNVDIEIHNHMPSATIGWVNVLMDWDQNGMWGGSSSCPTAAAPEHVLVNFPIPNPFDGPLSALMPPGFLIGPNPGYIWTRFSITEAPVQLPWIGEGAFEDGETEDYLLLIDPEPGTELEPKWVQPPQPIDEGFDDASDLWWQEGLPQLIKWEQPPNGQWPGLHAHDALIGPEYTVITLADQWECQGGEVTDLHWFGNYELDPFGQEIRGLGIALFDVAILDNTPASPWCLPGVTLWSTGVPFGAITEEDTGLLNSEGCIIYKYNYDLQVPFPQIQGEIYWLSITAINVDPGAPAYWRWQESNRTTPPTLCPAAEQQGPIVTPWQSIIWSTNPETYSDLAFEITSADPTPPVNKVDADDFISDGRPIRAVKWWGSYFDPMYMPDMGGQEPYLLDGWFIGFHHEVPSAGTDDCPPDDFAGDWPTTLGTYFAPVDAVTITPLNYTDCLGHDVYEYSVNLDACCLLCAHDDPRLPPILRPAEPEAFYEEAGFRYWLSIQAVTGVTWQPQACGYDDRILTGHLPSPNAVDGHFWGWHTSDVSVMAHSPLAGACTGQITDFSLYPPDCWMYGGWDKIQWQCPNIPPDPRVDLAFELLADRSVIDSTWSVVTHGAAGPIGLLLENLMVSPAGASNIEPRNPQIGQLDFEMREAMNPLSVNGASVQVQPGSGPYAGVITATSQPGMNGPDTKVVVTFSPALPDQDCSMVSLNGMITASGIMLDGAVMVRGLRGDTDRNAIVSTGDASIIKPYFGVTPGPATAVYDFDANGIVSTGDASTIKPLFGHSAPACP